MYTVNSSNQLPKITHAMTFLTSCMHITCASHAHHTCHMHITRASHAHHTCHMHITRVSHAHHMHVTCTSHAHHTCHMHITCVSHAHHTCVTCTSHVCHMHKYNAITCRSPAFANSTSILGSVAEKRRVCLDSGSRWRISRSCSEKPISNSLNVKWEHGPHYTHHAIPHTYSCMLVRKHPLVQTRTNANDP